MNDGRNPSSPPRFPRPLGRWVSVAVKDLPRATARKLRLEYHSHIVDGLEQLRGGGKDDEAATEKILRSLGDPEAARKKLNREHVTKADMKWIEKLTSRRRSIPRGRRYFVICWSAFLIVSLSLLKIPTFPLQLTCLVSGLVLLIIMFLIGDERAGESASARLTGVALEAPFSILIGGFYQAIGYKEGIQYYVIPIVIICFFRAHRAALLLLKLRRIARTHPSDPECKA